MSQELETVREQEKAQALRMLAGLVCLMSGRARWAIILAQRREHRWEGVDEVEFSMRSLISSTESGVDYPEKVLFICR
ncbi:hypothetical protein [Nocardia sp. R6R-6]|uniref:hypothetical protein n=1 Tax=Nocardia sp. R6R-6 TaxID=3459303 RepID=UPI00403DE470